MALECPEIENFSEKSVSLKLKFILFSTTEANKNDKKNRWMFLRKSSVSIFELIWRRFTHSLQIKIFFCKTGLCHFFQL